MTRKFYFRLEMIKNLWVFRNIIIYLCSISILTACSQNLDVTGTPIPQEQSGTTLEASSPDVTITPGIGTADIPTSKAACYQEILPETFQKSAAIEGWNLFAKSLDITTHYVYFPPNCSRVSMEQDVDNLFFGNTILENETIIMLLDPIYEGTLGSLYNHLDQYHFWGMGPEDYPMVIDRNKDIETNIIIYRVDRINGEGDEGNAVLTMMQNTAEHEYIHTVQASNNLDLSEMMWSDGVYRAFIERYANIRNNSGQRYYQASPTLLALLQFLDGLNTRGLLEQKTIEILNEKAIPIDSFLSHEVRVYDDNLKAHAATLGGEAYLSELSNGRISPLLLVVRAGCGDIEAYDVVRRLYDDNINDYNQWYYGTDEQQYMPTAFDKLFDPG